MKPMFLMTILWSILLGSVNYCFAQLNYYVSPNGNDVTGDGTSSQPYLTVEKVKSVIRAKTFPAGQEQDIIVNFHDGVYKLGSSLSFDAQDSGKGSKKITYKAINPGNVTISGGITVPDNLWTSQGGGIWRANLAGIYSSPEGMRQIYIGETRGIRARRSVNFTSLAPGDPNKYGYSQTSPTLQTIARPQDLEIVQNYKWILTRLKVVAIYPSGQSMAVDPIFGTRPFSANYENDVWWIENAKEFIDQTNEWYYDKSSSMLYLSSGITPSSVTIPNLVTLIQGDGVSGLRFEGLKFLHSTWLLPNEKTFSTKQGSYYMEDGQHWKAIPDAIQFAHSTKIEFHSNTFSKLGNDALSFQRGSKDVTISNNNFSDISGSAIDIGQGTDAQYVACFLDGFESNPALVDITEHINISNNSIQNVANEYYGSVGIFLTFARNVSIVSNTLSDLPYSGISTGFCWSTKPSILGNIIVSNNVITNALAPVFSNHGMSDGGGIYNLGVHSPGSTISNNQINGLTIPNLAGNMVGPKTALYFDQASSNITVSGNYGTGRPDVENIFRNYDYPCQQSGMIYSENNFSNFKDHWISNSEWTQAKTVNNTLVNFTQPFKTQGVEDNGVRILDVDHDGLDDIVYYYWGSPTDIQVGGYKNNGTGFDLMPATGAFALPYHIAASGFPDMRVEFVDFDNDGFKDMLYCRSGYPDQCKAFRSTGSGWQYMSNYNPPKAHFSDIDGDLGVRYVDVNMDHFPDLVYFRWNSATSQDRGVYLNTGNGWAPSSNTIYLPPYHFVAGGKDMGVRFVDLNNDGFDDFLYWRWDYQQKGAYTITSSGWQSSNNYVPPYPTSQDNGGDLGVRFVRINDDERKDLVYYRVVSSSQVDVDVYLNQNNSWVQSYNYDFRLPIPIVNDNVGDLGVRFANLNGDDREDLIKSFKDSNGAVSTLVYMNHSRDFVCDNPGGRKGEQKSTSVDSNIVSAEANRSEFAIFPSPATNSIFISWPTLGGADDANILIKDMTGRLVKATEISLSKGTKEIDIFNLPRGMYIVELKALATRITGKFVKID